MSTPKRMRAKSIGHYILGKTIGEGTFGKVKVGTHILTGEKVAVKILEKDRIVDVADVERVAREIHILKLIQHPHVIRLFEIIETPRQLYLITEYCSGGELFDLIVASGRVAEKNACRFFQQIIAGVEQIHRMNVVHRDLKPENLLLDENNSIKIVDFGLSNTFQDGQLLKTACGSPCYAAPEMIAGHRYVPSCCDLWSCGVILFALVCGYLPFEDQNTSQLYKKILACDYQTPDFISEGVRDLIQRLLTVDPVSRITAQQVHGHPWFTQIPDTAVSAVREMEDPEEDLLQQLERFGFLREYASKCLQMNKHNHVTTTYHLLAEKKRRLTGQLLASNDMPASPTSQTGRWGADSIHDDLQKTLEEMSQAFPHGAFDKHAGVPGAYHQQAGPMHVDHNEKNQHQESIAQHCADSFPADADRAGGASRPVPPDHYAERLGVAVAGPGCPCPCHTTAVDSSSQVMPTPRPGSARTPEPTMEAVTRTPQRREWNSTSATGRSTDEAVWRTAGTSGSRLSSHDAPQRKLFGVQQATTVTPPPRGSVATPTRISASAGGSQSARGPSPGSARPGAISGTTAARGPSRPPGSATARTALDARRRHYTGVAGPPVAPTTPDPTRSSVSSRPMTGSNPTAIWSSRAAGGSSQASTASPRTATPSQEIGQSVQLDGGSVALPLSARDPQREEMRSCRGAFNVSCTSSRSPKVIMQEIQRALHAQRVLYKQASPFLIRCQRQALRFEMEITKLDQLESIHVVRFRRLVGEAAPFKDLCAKVLAEMKI